ncbi:MAG TPA: YCF48-related protein [Chitinophagaceae bacterium]
MPKHYLLRAAGFLLGVMMIASLKSHAQLNPSMGSNPWKYANPSQYGFLVQDMSFVDNNNGLGVGTSGAITKTTDGGYSWQYIFFKYVSPANQVSLPSLNDVHFVTPSVAYAVGNSGVMIKSTDGGSNWAQITTPLTALSKNINGLHFLNKDTGYIAGASINTTNTTNVNDAPKIYITRNGGTTWDSLVTPFVRQETNASLNWNNNKEIFRLHFVNDSVGYASGNAGSGQSSLLWKIEKNVITDYSLHRSKFGLASGSYQPATSVYKGLVGINDSMVLISSLNNGFIVRIRTGKNDSTASAVPATYGAFVRGKYEMVAISNTNPTSPPNLPFALSPMNHMKKAPDGKIFIVNAQVVAFSPDNGTTWTGSYPGVPYGWWGLLALDITPNGRIIAGGDGGSLYDSLPGGTWRTQYKHVRPIYSIPNLAPGVQTHFSAIDWADYCNGIIVGAYGTFVKTSDGGKTWVNNTNPVFEGAQIGIASVAYQGVNSLFFQAGAQFIYKSPDQGTSFTGVFAEPHPNGTINGFTMVGTDKMWAIGHRSGVSERTMIFRSLNANAAIPVWDTVKTFPNAGLAPQLNLIRFANQDTGYVTGNRGKVYRTVDGGNTWTDISPDTTASVNGNLNGVASYTGLSVINGKTLYVGGSRLRLFKSTDAGVTWTNLTLVPTVSPLTFTTFNNIGNLGTNGIVMNDENNGYLIVGSYLLKTTDGWATWTFDMVPMTFANMQLYPKINAPIQSKKLYYIGVVQIGFQNSKDPATLLEYGNAPSYNMSTTETSTGSSCTNPTAGIITVTATGGIAPYTYSIDGGAFQSSNVFTGLSTGNKTVVIKDAGCQVITKIINIGFTDNLTLTASNDTTVCAGAPVQLQATATPGATFSWTPTAGLSNANISNPVAIVNAAATFTVRATLNGCVKTEPVNIAIKPNPAVSAGSDQTIVDGDEAQLSGSANNAVSVAWTPANTLNNANTFSPIAKPSVTTTYTMTVRNTDNCTSTDDVKITVLPYCVKVMNAFSPNGDGANDRWIVTNGAGCTNRIKAAVFNRYGHQVYINENYQNNWDGTFNGKPVPDGTYYYAITYFFINGRTAIVKGDVTILR